MSPHRLFCRPQLRRPLTSAVTILFMEFTPSLLFSYFVSNACMSVMHSQRLSDDLIIQNCRTLRHRSTKLVEHSRVVRRRWLGHVERMTVDRIPRNALQHSKVKEAKGHPDYDG